MTILNPTDYPPAIADLLRAMPLAPLGPGTPVQSARAALAALDDAAFGRVTDRNMAAACRAGLWLAFNDLDESHEISQGLHTPEGSYWHAIMHRREPDPSNSKYWWVRVGAHPVLQQLVEQAPALRYNYTNPFDFVDFCEENRGSGSGDETLARKVQLLEWQLLFAHCFRGTIA